MATKFNMIGFGVGNGIANVNQFKLIAVKVDKGTPLTVPEAPWKDYYVSQWGFNGGTGGWDLTPGDVVGDVSISGSAAATDLVALRGGLASFTINSDSTKSLVIEGKAEFVGGGFEAANSFSFGVFQSDSAKSVKDSAWTGTDRASSGYLFVPGSGSNVLPKWGTSAASGSVGGVVSGKWSDFTNAANYSLSTVSQQPSSAVGKVGKYTFKMSVYTTTSNKNDVRFVIYNADKSYFFGGKVVDGHHSITKFNGIGFALRPNTGTTALKVTDVQVTRGNPLPFKDVTDVTEENSGLPKQYELSQNYPNPFNPTTTIKFALPNSGNVSLIVYDILGRNVATLVNSDLKAGYHTVSFNASNLSTGVYFYRIEAGNFVSVKKLMLLK
jgi:hypothetical protein